MSDRPEDEQSASHRPAARSDAGGPEQAPPPLVEPPAPEPAPPPPLVEPAPAEPAPTEPGESSSWDQPTQLMAAVPAEAPPPSAAPAPDAPAEPPATEPFAPADLAAAEPHPAVPHDAAADLAATELLGAASLGHDTGTTSALETLFGDQNFRDYTEEPAESPLRPRARAAEASPHASVPASGISRTQKILLAVAGGFVALLALVALFLLGTRLADLSSAPVTAPSASPSPSPSPSPSVEPVGPAEPGVRAWDELRGGECLADYTDPWAEEFTVVDCAEPHPAQMVYRGVFPPSAEGVTDDPFPGAEALQGQLSLLCSAPGVVDLAVAGQYPDVQLQGSYPATQAQWDAGERRYYCFVTRSSGEPLTGSLAAPPAAPAG